jgi:hypothetical protein
MMQARQDRDLAAEAPGVGCGRNRREQQLEYHRAVEPPVTGQVDRRCRPAAQLPFDHVALLSTVRVALGGSGAGLLEVPDQGLEIGGALFGKLLAHAGVEIACHAEGTGPIVRRGERPNQFRSGALV